VPEAGSPQPSPMPSWAEIRARHRIHEDEALLALDKPTGISVMGERHDLDLVRLAEAAGERLFPVHRIDKATSGLILFARELRFHGDLTRQFQRRTAGKCYLVLTRTRSCGLPAAGTIDLPLSVGRKNRVRIAASRTDILADLPPSAISGSASSGSAVSGSASAGPVGAGASGPGGASGAAGSEPAEPEEGRWTVPAGSVFDQVPVYPSVTTFVRLWEGGEFTLLAATPVTGRRHQIRVHLAWIGHPIVGDPLFDRAPTTRTLLHSWRLMIDAGGRRLHLEAPPGPDFWTAVDGLIPPDLPAALPDLVTWDPPAQVPAAAVAPEEPARSSRRPAAARRRRSGGRAH